MLLEIKVPAESFATYFTGKWLLVVVRVHVESQVVDLVESFVTYVTLVCLFTAVRQLVVLIVALLVETFAAVLADKWLVVRMNARMSVQC